MNEDIKELEGVKMLVWDFDEDEPIEREVFGKIGGSVYPIVAKIGNCPVHYKHAKPLPKPWEVAPDGYRLVTDEDRTHKKPDCAMFYDGEWMGVSGYSNSWSDFYSYAVPLTFTFEEVVTTYTPEEALKELEKLAGGKVRIEGGK